MFAVPSSFFTFHSPFSTLRSALALSLLCAALIVSGCKRDEVVAPGQDHTPPAKPAGLTVDAAQDGYIQLGWSPNTESDLRGYLVYRAETPAPGAFRLIDTAYTNDYLDVNLNYDTTYRYCIAAIDASGNVSQPSDTVQAKSPNVDPPGPPGELFVSGHNDAAVYMALSWIPAPDADIAGYRIYRSTSNTPRNDPAHRVFFSVRPWYGDSTGLEPDIAYYYAVTTVDRGGLESGGEVDGADFITAKPELIDPPDGGFVPSWLTFRWHRVAGASQYRVSVATSPDAGELWSKNIDETGIDTLETQYDGPILTVGRIYYWRVATITGSASLPNALSVSRMFQVSQ